MSKRREYFLIELNKVNNFFQYDHVDIIAFAFKLDVTITMLRCQYLKLHFGQTFKHLRKFLCEVVPTSMMTIICSFGVEKIHLLHGNNMFGC